MTNSSKQFIQYSIIIISVIIGGFVGYFLHKHILPNMGANYITPKDIIGCYVGSVVVIGFAGIMFSVIYLEDKLK